MAVSYLDNVFVVSTTTGTGTLTQSGTVTGYAAPASGDNGKTFVIMIKAVDANGLPTGEWELCESVYTHSGTTWSRGDLIDSSTGSRVNFAAGTKRVAIVQVARDIGSDSQIALPEIGITTGTTLTLGRRHVMTGTSADYTCPLPTVSGNTGKKVIVRMSPLLSKLVTLDAGVGVTINGKSTTLSAAISSTSSTSISVASGTGFPPNGDFVIQIDNELLKVTAGHGTTTWTVVRGISGTTAATHSNGASVDWNRTRIMMADEAATLVCDGSNWFKTEGKSKVMHCQMTLSANQTLTTGSTFYFVAWNEIKFDSAGMANTGSNSVGIKRPGRYEAASHIVIQNSGGVGISAIELNSSSPGTTFHGYQHVQNTVYPTLMPGKDFNLAVGDSLKVNVQASASSATVLTSTDREYAFFAVKEIDPW